MHINKMLNFYIILELKIQCELNEQKINRNPSILGRLSVIK